MKINVRLLVILLVVGIVLAGSVFGLYKLQKRNLAGDHLDRAREAAERADSPERTKEEHDRDRAKAMKHYGKYLELNPNDADVQAEYGLFLKKHGDFKGAEFYLQKAVRSTLSNETREKVLEALADIMLIYTRPADAKRHLEELLELNPENLDYKESLAKCWLLEKDDETAEKMLLEIIKKDPTKLSSYQELVGIYEDRAKSRTPGIEPESPEDQPELNEDSPGLSEDKAEDEAKNSEVPIELSEGEAEHAKSVEKLLDEMIEKNPKNAEAYRIRSQYYFSHRQEEKGDKDLKTALGLAPKDPKVLSFAAYIARRRGDIYTGEKLSKTLIEVAPHSPEGYFHLAMLKKGKQIVSQNTEAGADEKAKQEEVLKILDKGIHETGGNPSLVFYKADCLIDLGRVKEAQQEMRLLSQQRTGAGPLYTNYLNARILYFQKNWAKARGLFEGLLPVLEGNPYLDQLRRSSYLFLGECCRQLGDTKKSLEYSNRAYRSNTALQAANPLAEGQILRQEGKLNEAIAHFKQLLTNNPDIIQVYIELMPLLVRRELQKEAPQRNWSEADEILAKAIEIRPNDPRVAKLQVQVILGKNPDDIEKAESILNEAVQRANTRAKQWSKLLSEVQYIEASQKILELIDAASKKWGQKNYYLEKAAEFAKKGNINSTLGMLKAGEKVQSDTQVLWQTRIAIAEQQKDWKRAEDIVREAIRTVGDSAVFRKLLAGIMIRQNREEAPARLETILQNLDKLPKNQQKDIQEFLAKQLYTLGKKDRAIEICENVVKQNPRDLYAQRLLFSFALETDNEEIMDRTLNEIGKIEEGVEHEQKPYWNFLTAQRMTYHLLEKAKLSREDRDTIDAALDYLRIAEQARHSWEDAELLFSELYNKIGNERESIDHLIEAVRLGTQNPRAMSRLAEYYTQQGRLHEAEEIFNKIQNSRYTLGPKGLISLVNLKIRQNDPKGAMRELERAVEFIREEAAENKDVKTYIRLSTLLHTAVPVLKKFGKRELADAYEKESKEAIVKASEADPSNYLPWIMLAAEYKEQGNVAKVEEMVSQLKRNTPEEGRALALAKCYEALRRTIEAELSYREALKTATESNRIARLVAAFYLRHSTIGLSQYKKAETILRQIIDGKLPANEGDRLWAKSYLASMLLQQRSQKAHVEAMRLVKENLQKNPNSLVDLRLKSRCLATNGTRKGKREAIEMLEELAKKSRLSDDDRFELAQLYQLAGRRSNVDEQMMFLRGMKSVDLRWYEFYARCLIDQKEFSAAQENLDVLKKAAPNYSVTAELEALLYAGTDQPNEAIQTLENFVNDPKSRPDNELRKLKFAGETFEKLANSVTAEDEENKEESKKVRRRYLDQAEKYFRELAQKSRKDKMNLASFLGRAGKRDEAITLAEESWKINEPRALSSAVIRLINAGDATPAQNQRVEKILDDAKKHFGDSVFLKTAVAELRTLQKRYEDAEKLYKEVLKEDPENLIALNNMAVFYALRKTRLNDALAAVNKAIELAGSIGTLLDTRSSIYYAQKQYEKALDDINAALQDERTPVRLFHQAQIQWAAGDKRNAKKSFTEALNLGLRTGQLQPLERSAFRTLHDEINKS